MIIPQGYPLWVVHGRGHNLPEAAPVVAWSVGDGNSKPHPWPVTACCGTLDTDDISSYLDTEAAVADFRRSMARAQRDEQLRREADRPEIYPPGAYE
ncbi:hypothetical protein ACFQS1_12865 [Paractinoplanes rhizophilus]|uniref:Uncharacterized protein n=1 Tax=Paractinoplanes rhizophilus TaxID=1416877 RepID=A0ABW2HTM5_9ACTN